MRHRLAWLIAGLVAAAVVIQGAVAAVLWQVARPRVAPVSTVTATADTAIAQVVRAAGDSVAVTVSSLVAATPCQHTMLAHGHIYTRTADLYVDPGGEEALIGHIAAALPADDHPVRGAALVAGPQPLTANVGQGVALRVQQLGSGWLAATATTDCRGGAPPRQAPDTQAGAAPAPIASVFAALGTSTAEWHAETVTCPVGQITTVDATSQTTDRFNLPTRLAAALPAGAHRIATPANRVIWREGPISMIIAAGDDNPQITVQRTTSC